MKFFAIAQIGLVLVMLAWVFYRRFTNPDLTETELFLKFALEWAFLFFMAGILGAIGTLKRFND